jgi:hypothetical protein
VKHQGKRKPVRTKSSSQEGGLLADVRLRFRAVLGRTIADSAAEFRDDLLTSRTILERQRDLAERLDRLRGTFPALLAGHAQELCAINYGIEWVNAELSKTKAQMKRELNNWIPLACDGVEADSSWRCPAWFVEHPIAPSSPRAHMPVELLGGRLSAESTARISAAIAGKIEEGLALALANARVHALNCLRDTATQVGTTPIVDVANEGGIVGQTAKPIAKSESPDAKRHRASEVPPWDELKKRKSLTQREAGEYLGWSDRTIRTRVAERRLTKALSGRVACDDKLHIELSKRHGPSYR